MQERRPKNNLPLEEVQEEESKNDIGLFIDNLFPPIFESILGLKPVRDVILPEARILFTDPYPLLLRFNIQKDGNLYDFSYGAVGKSDKAFNMTKNPRFINGKQTSDSMFVLMDSPNDYFTDPISGSTFAISTIRQDENGMIKHINNFDACEEGATTLDFIKNLRDATVILNRNSFFLPGELPASYE